MNQFLDLTLNGVSYGMILAAVALSLVLIWRSTRVVNFATGAMFMVTTFVAYSVIRQTGSYWVGFAAAVLAGLVLGAITERLLIRPVEGKPALNAIMVTIGWLVLLQAVAGMVWGGTPRSFPPAFSIHGFEVGGDRLLFSPFDAFVVATVLGLMVLLVLLFRRTSVGLRMRASAFAPEVSRMVGVRVGRMLTLGWALATGTGALAGLLVAPQTFVGPNQFDSILVFGFTAAVIGGLDSPPGALLGGLTVGLVLSYISGYLSTELTPVGTLAVLLAVLMVRPTGLLAGTRGRKV